MQDKTEQAIIDALLLDGQNSKAKAVTRKKREPKKKETGLVDFHDIEGVITFADKPVEKWNKIDLRQYFNKLYQETFNSKTPFTIVHFYSKTQDVARALATAMTIDKVPPSVMREFYDWYFAEHMRKVVAKFNGFRLEWMGKGWIIDEFIATRHLTPDQQVNAAPVITPTISVEEINEMANVSFSGVVTKFGLVIAVNWIMKFKNASTEKAMKAVEKTTVKVVQQDRRFWVNIIAATQKWGPYPDWLWQEVDGMTDAIEKASRLKLDRIILESGATNPMLDFLRSK